MDAVTFRVARQRAAPTKRKLTDRKVASLKANGSTTIIWDTAQRGLGLRIQPSGHKSWVVVYRHHRKPRWLTLPLVPVQAAREKATEVMLAVLRGQDPAPERKDGPPIFFGTLAQRYVEQHSSKKNKSWKHASRLVQRYLLPSWANVDAATITRASICTPGRCGLSRRAAIPAAAAASRANNVTVRPARAMTLASAVPHAPAPTTAIRSAILLTRWPKMQYPNVPNPTARSRAIPLALHRPQSARSRSPPLFPPPLAAEGREVALAW